MSKDVYVYRGPFIGMVKVSPEDAKKEPKMLYSCLTANTAGPKYYIDYEGCPMECTKEEYEAEMERLKAQTGDAK